MPEVEDLVLHPEVEIFPVDELEDTVRRQLGEGGDFVLTRRRARHASLLASAATVRFLERFRQPISLTDAALAESRAIGRPAIEILEDAHDVLCRLMKIRILVVPSAEIEEAARPLLEAGEEPDEVSVLGVLRRMEDVELYLVALADGIGVLKLRRYAAEDDQAAIAAEVAALERAPAGIAPSLLKHGQWRDRPFLVTEFFPGVGLEAAAKPLRATRDRPTLFGLVHGVATAYRELHGAGIVHGDVHPHNVLVARDGRGLRLIDFGQAVLAAGGAAPRFGGVAYYFAPEHARALLADRSPIVSAQSEQFALAALLFRSITGEHYASFQIQRQPMLEQIAATPPRSFESLGIEPWPAMEAVLQRALAKESADRFRDLEAFAGAVAAAAPEGPAAPGIAGGELDSLRRRWVRDAAIGRAWWSGRLAPPRAPVMKGAAGIALGLYRMSIATQDASLLSAADQWARRAGAWADSADGLAAPEPWGTAGERNPYHGASGIAVVQALIAASSGHEMQFAESVRGFLEASRHPSAGLDLTLGAAGTLAACAWLHRRAAVLRSPLRSRLSDLAEAELRELWRRLAEHPDLAHGEGYAGIAHGWAGYLYATLLWCDAVGRELPAAASERLAELRELAMPRGRGAGWPVHLERAAEVYGNHLSGWCHGSAGYVLLWCLTAEVTQDPEYLATAEDAAWHTWDDPAVAASLCCGLIGRAYALLAYHRATGEAAWLRRAEHLAMRACRSGRFGKAHRHDLFKGELALAMLAADLGRPEEARFPFFEEEGWEPLRIA